MVQELILFSLQGQIQVSEVVDGIRDLTLRTELEIPDIILV